MVRGVRGVFLKEFYDCSSADALIPGIPILATGMAMADLASAAPTSG